MKTYILIKGNEFVASVSLFEGISMSEAKDKFIEQKLTTLYDYQSGYHKVVDQDSEEGARVIQRNVLQKLSGLALQMEDIVKEARNSENALEFSDTYTEISDIRDEIEHLTGHIQEELDRMDGNFDLTN